MPFSPPSKFYPPEGPGWMKPSQVPRRQNESLPHCLLAPQPIAHSIKTEEIVLVLFCLPSCSTMLLAPLERSLGLSVPFISSHRDKKPVASPPRKWFCAAQSAVGEVRAIRIGRPSLTLLPPPWVPEVIQHCCLAVFLWGVFTAVCSLLALHGHWTRQAHCTSVS